MVCFPISNSWASVIILPIPVGILFLPGLHCSGNGILFQLLHFITGVSGMAMGRDQKLPMQIIIFGHWPINWEAPSTLILDTLMKTLPCATKKFSFSIPNGFILLQRKER